MGCGHKLGLERSSYVFEKQREEAIKLYIKFRFKAAKACNYLGYPDRRMLKKWYQEYIDCGNKVVANYSGKPAYSK